MAYQFMHVETYSEQAKPVKGSRDHFNSAAQVEGEAARDALYSDHVEKPLPPFQLPSTLTIAEFRKKRAEILENVRETVTRSDGTTYTRGLRKDAATLYTEIHSHPLTSKEYLDDPDAHAAAIKTWCAFVLANFKARMPKGVDFTAVLHLDEGQVHIHILAMNTADPKLDANKLHAGKVAAAIHRQENVSDAIISLPKPVLGTRPKKPKKPRPSKNRVTQKKNDTRHANKVFEWEAQCAGIDAENAVLISEWEAINKLHLRDARRKRGRPSVNKTYVAAMKNLQDDYYEAVGKPCGLLRVGPRLARKSTKEYAADKQQAKRMADVIAHVAKQSTDQAIKADALVARAGELMAAKTALAGRKVSQKAADEAQTEAFTQERLSLEKAKLEDQKVHDTRERNLVKRERDLNRREEELDEAVNAMVEVFAAVESGAAKVVDGKLTLSRWPDIIARMQGPERDGVSSPVRRLITGFARLVVRFSKRMTDSDAPFVDDEAPRP